MNQSREAHLAERPLHSPEGMRSRALSTRHQELAPLQQPVGAQGLPQSRRVHVSNALTCVFAPLAGLEPATYGLEVIEPISPQYAGMALSQFTGHVTRYPVGSHRPS